MEVALQLQAMQLDYARQAIAQAQAEQPAALPADPAHAAPPPVPDVVLDLSLAAQQLLGG